MSVMLENQLEIPIFTYNRAKSLDRTLQQLHDGPFGRCKIIVLDNASTDETPEVCAKWAQRMPNLRIVRHPKNIGASANYLRAVELSTAFYTWVLCDDDTYDFSDCQDVLDELEAGHFDWICVGAPGQHPWEHGLRTTTGALWKRGSRFFIVHTFVPSLIFKTELFDSECMARGYANAVNLYPHHRFVQKGLEQNVSEYVSRQTMVHREAAQTVNHGLHFLVAAFSSTATIPDPHVRRLTLYQAADTRWQWLRMLAEAIVLAKLDRPEKASRVPRQFVQLALACVGEQRMRFLLLTPLALMPSGLLKLIRAARRKAQGRSKGDTDPDAPSAAAAAGDSAMDALR